MFSEALKFPDGFILILFDKLLQKNASNQANLGTDSTDLERFETKVKWAELLREIRRLDPEFAEMIHPE